MIFMDDIMHMNYGIKDNERIFYLCKKSVSTAACVR